MNYLNCTVDEEKWICEGNIWNRFEKLIFFCCRWKWLYPHPFLANIGHASLLIEERKRWNRERLLVRLY
jgi:hypothetical protein